MIIILDYGVGNLASIFNMLRRIGTEAIVTDDINTIRNAKKLILPGVGHFDYCMQQLRTAPFFDLINAMVLDNNVPVIGVCAGCQMLFGRSEEGIEPGLGWLKGKVVKFNNTKFSSALKIPHMGWTDVQPEADSIMYKGVQEPRFYFVHSYHVEVEDKSCISASAEYGYRFVASVEKDNIYGVQFHPEKSHRFGMQLLQNFVQYS
jgi:imidazole glycerol-phosphate synthase subunit HisH